jgi:hypothetical protein
VYQQVGYKTLSLTELCNGVGALLSGFISLETFKVYLGCFEILAVRDAARHSPTKKGEKGIHLVRYQPSELQRLLPGSSDRRVREALKALHKIQLLSFSESSITVSQSLLPFGREVLSRVGEGRSETRLIPIPRTLLRYLCSVETKTLLLTTLGYIVRGLSLSPKTRSIKSRGTAKATWIADAFSLSERSVRYARRELIKLSLLSEDTTKSQRKLNRDGAYFEMNLSWGRGEKKESLIAPPLAKDAPQIAPPIRDLETSYGSRDQKTSSGLLKKDESETPPALRDVKRRDLEEFSRTKALYDEAVQKGVVKASESAFLNWVSAAVRAKTTSANDPVKVFVGIVRAGLFHHITNEQEERARRAISRYKSQQSDSHDREICSMMATADYRDQDGEPVRGTGPLQATVQTLYNSLRATA